MTIVAMFGNEEELIEEPKICLQMMLLGSPSVMNMLAPLLRRMFAFAYRENEFMLSQVKGFWSEGKERPC